MRVSTLSLLVLVLFSAECAAQPVAPPIQNSNRCDIELFKEITSDKVTTEDHIFFLNLVTKDNYEDMKRSVDTSWDGPYGFFKGNYDELRAKRENYRNELRYNLDSRYSRDYALNTLNDNGLKAYTACINAGQPNFSLALSRFSNDAVDKVVTFQVSLKADADLNGKLSIDVFGGGRVLSQSGPNVRVSYDDGVTHIVTDQPRGTLLFTVQRKDSKAEFRATAQIAGLIAPTFIVGPTLERKIEQISSPVTSRGSFTYLARRLGNGSNDWVYAIDGQNGSDKIGGLNGRACLCDSEERTAATLPLSQAGVCIAPKDPDNISLVTDSVKLQPESFLKEFSCGGLGQAPATIVEKTPHSVCYGFSLSLNAPVQWSSSITCEVVWTMTGMVTKKRTVFVAP